MKAKLINLNDLGDASPKSGRPRAKLPKRELLLSMRDQGLTLREISTRMAIPLSTLGDALRGSLTPKQKARRRKARRKRRTRIEIWPAKLPFEGRVSTLPFQLCIVPLSFKG